MFTCTIVRYIPCVYSYMNYVCNYVVIELEDLKCKSETTVHEFMEPTRTFHIFQMVYVRFVTVYIVFLYCYPSINSNTCTFV